MSLVPAASLVAAYTAGGLLLARLAGGRALRRLARAGAAGAVLTTALLVVNLTPAGGPGLLPHPAAAATGVAATALTIPLSAALLGELAVAVRAPRDAEASVQDRV